MNDSLCENARRLFAHYDDVAQLPRSAAPFVIAKLLEEGDSRDLRWLIGMCPENELGDWLDRHGARQLSRRSRSFWKVILDRAVSTTPSSGDELWPL